MSSPRVRQAIVVNAPADRCWRVIIDFSGWPRWIPLVRRAAPVSQSTPWQKGGCFEMVFGAGPVCIPTRQVVAEITPGRLVRWTGGRYGVVGNHAYIIEPRGPDTTWVVSDEVFTGPVARMAPGPTFRWINRLMVESMAKYKSVVEAA